MTCRVTGARRFLPAPTTIEDLSAQLGELLARHNIARAHIAGISLGGLIAQQFAATRPDMVDHLILIDTTPRYTDELRAMWAQRAATARARRKLFRELGQNLGQHRRGSRKNMPVQWLVQGAWIPPLPPSKSFQCAVSVTGGALSRTRREGGIKPMRAVRKSTTGPCGAAAPAPRAAPRPRLRVPPRTSRRLVCRERSIVRGDGGRFTTPPPSRLEARSRLGDKAANELGAPVVSSIPAQLPGLEPASARKGREDDRAVLRWNRCVAGPA